MAGDTEYPGVATAPTLNGHEPASLIRDGLRVLAERARIWAVTGMAFSLFVWCAARPDWIRLATACAFTVLVLVPTVWRERRR